MMKQKGKSEFDFLRTNYQIESLSQWMFFTSFSEDAYWERVFSLDLRQFFHEDGLKETLKDELEIGRINYVFVILNLENSCNSGKVFDQIDNLQKNYYLYKFIIVLGDSFTPEDREAIVANYKVQTSVLSPAPKMLASVLSCKSYCIGRGFHLSFNFDENGDCVEAQIFPNFEEMIGNF